MAGPLSGVRIIDLTMVISGPMAAAYLADQGADVIKVESPSGDISRGLGPAKGTLSAMFIAANRGKRSVVLDLKEPAGRKALEALIETADVILENFRPGALARLGLTFERAQALSPRIIWCSISGFGQTGPYAGVRVYDPIIQATSGMASLQRDPRDGAPSLIQSLVCDKLTALTGAQAITAALFARERSGTGQKIELSMLDASIAFLWPEGMWNYTFLDDPPPMAPELGSFYRLAKTKDGYVAASSVQDAEFRAYCEGLGRPDLASDPRFATIAGRMMNAGDLRAEIEAQLLESESAALMQRMAAAGAPFGVLNERDALPKDPQVAHNGSIVTVDHGALGRVRQPRHPALFSATPVPSPRPAPALGADTEDILSALGWSAGEIAKARGRA